jgi:hypothetical protein
VVVVTGLACLLAKSLIILVTYMESGESAKDSGSLVLPPFLYLDHLQLQKHANNIICDIASIYKSA